MLALTYKCQCHCAHCGSFLHKEPGGKTRLNHSEISYAIDELADAGFSQIYFFGGEPLLVPELSSYIKHSAKRKMRTRLDTNGLLLDESMVKKLKEEGLALIGISIDSHDPEIHDNLRGVKGTFNKALDGIKHCKKYGLHCYISTYATKDRIHNGNLKKIIGLAKELGVFVRILSPIKAGNLIDSNDVTLSQGDIFTLKGLIEKNKVYWEEIDCKTKPFYCSAHAKNLLYIDAYGNVCPCCYIPLSFGNIRKKKFNKIVKRMWGSSLYDTNKNGLADCLANYMDLGWIIKEKGGYPIHYEDYFSAIETKEWDEWAANYAKEVDILVGINDDFVAKKISFKNKTVLDVGSGTGRFAKRIVSEVKNITLLDFSANMLDECKKTIGYPSKTFFLNMSIEKNDFLLKNKFDIITIFHLMHHLENPSSIIEKLKLHLNDRGKIVIVEVLKNNGDINNALFNLKIALKYGFLKYLRQCFTENNTHLKRHLLRDEYETFEGFKKQYKHLLPGADIQKINGIFAFLEWEKTKLPAMECLIC